MIKDIHTHALRHDALVNIDPCDCAELTPGYTYSAGIHPWNAHKADDALWSHLDRLLASPQVKAVGETGIDLLRGPAEEVQTAVFLRHAALSEQHSKPLIIHCVRAWQQIIALRRRLNPAQPWIIHGFRGKPQLALQLLDAGFSISLGPRFNPRTAAIIPADRLFLETDDDPTTPISAVADAVAAARNA